MGRLPALIGLALLGCPSEGPAPTPSRPHGRADVVVRDPAKAAADAAAATHEAPPAPVVHRTGPLCEPAGREPIEVAAPPAEALAAEGAAPAPAIDPGADRWTWINLWAAWCVPCREEMPLLRGWIDRLTGEGVPIGLALVSLDDDERQLRQFLDRATGALPRASAWMRGGTARTRWLESVGLLDSPALPVQILVRPGGTLACLAKGALEPSDFDAIHAIVKP